MAEECQSKGRTFQIPLPFSIYTLNVFFCDGNVIGDVMYAWSQDNKWVFDNTRCFEDMIIFIYFFFYLAIVISLEFIVDLVVCVKFGAKKFIE